MGDAVQTNYCLFRLREESQESTSSVSFDLDLITSNLAEMQQHFLRTFIWQQYNRSHLFPEGTIDNLALEYSSLAADLTTPNAEREQEPTVCFYILLGSSRRTDDSTSSASKLRFVLCLCLHCPGVADEQVELFRSELTQFCGHVDAQLCSLGPSADTSERVPQALLTRVTDLLESWFDHCIAYFSRSVELCGSTATLERLLYSILTGHSLDVAVGESLTPNDVDVRRAVDDLQWFVRAIEVQSLVTGDASLCDNGVRLAVTTSSDPTVANEAGTDSPTWDMRVCLSRTTTDPSGPLRLSFVDDSPQAGCADHEHDQEHIAHAGTNEFCHYWAERLVGETNTNPFVQRALSQQQRNFLIRDINDVRRLVAKARLDNYAMYDIYVGLTRHSGARVLLQLLARDKSNAGDRETSEVLLVLRESLAALEKAG